MIKRFFYLFIFSLVAVFATCNYATAQNINQIKAKCPVVIGGYSYVLAQANGDINAVPCVGKDFLVNGSAVGGGGNISGNGTANYFPYFTALHTIDVSPFSWSGTAYALNNTALNSEFKLDLTPSTTAGVFRAGDCAITVTNCIDINQSTNRIFITSNTNVGLRFNDIIANRVTLGTIDGTTNAGILDIIGNAIALSPSANNTGSTQIGTSANAITAVGSTDTLTTSLHIWDLSGVNGVTTLKFLRTITAGGTTGDQTINQLNGSVNFAAGASSLTVTNSTVSTTSLILAVAQTNDATCSVKNAVAGSGSFVINLTANCTAETKVAFWVTN
jgi:hypothetical protein